MKTNLRFRAKYFAVKQNIVKKTIFK